MKKIINKLLKLLGLKTDQIDIGEPDDQTIINYVDHKMKDKPPGYIVKHPFNIGEYFTKGAAE